MARNPGDNKPGTGPGSGADRSGGRHDAGTGPGRDLSGRTQWGGNPDDEEDDEDLDGES